MADIKSRFDKKLKKYHIEYHKLKNKGQYRYDIIKHINQQYETAVHIETQLGSEHTPDQTEFARSMERQFSRYGLTYQVRPMELPPPKGIFGISFGGKKTVTHYAITFIIPQGALNPEMFEDLLCEYDVQIGYDMIQPVDVFFSDMMKGYIKDIFDSGYFEQCFYDSRIFSKFLATEDLNELVK